MVKIKVIRTESSDLVFESEPTELSDAMETVRVLLKPSVFGVCGFQIVVERV